MRLTTSSARWARIAEEEGLEPLIITGDKDALQLATDVTQVLITKKGISEFDLYDREKMIERYQLTPEQFIDLKGLMGDQSDNIPGIPGVGEKTGIKLLTQFGSVANLLANTDQISNAKLRAKVEENAQLAAMSRRLATINKNVPLDIELEKYKVSEPDSKALIDLYVKLEFNSFLKSCTSRTSRSSCRSSQKMTRSTNVSPWTKREQLDLLAEALSGGAEPILKIFSNNDHISKPELYGAAFLIGEEYFLRKPDGRGTCRGFLIELLDERKPVFRGHDLVKDYYALMSWGLSSADNSL